MSNTKGVGGAKPCWQTLSSKPCLPSRLVSVVGKVDAPRKRCIAVQLWFRLNLGISCNMYPSCAEFFGEPHTWPPSRTWSPVVRHTSIMSRNKQSQCMPSAVKRLAFFGSWYKHKLCRLHTEDLCRETTTQVRMHSGEGGKASGSKIVRCCHAARDMEADRPRSLEGEVRQNLKMISTKVSVPTIDFDSHRNCSHASHCSCYWVRQMELFAYLLNSDL
jgi:hypothetical protein